MAEPAPILIGRDRELARLDQAAEAARAGHSTFVLVVGEAGIGKSRLLDAAAGAASRRGLRVLRGSAVESGDALPYLPLLGPLGEATRADDSAAAARVRLVLLGEAGRAGGAERAPALTPPGPGTPTGADAARLVEAVHAVLTRVPTMVLVDDIQWADAATLLVLDYLGHRAGAQPLAVIVAAREDAPAALDGIAIADGRRYGRLVVGSLSREQVAAQVRSLSSDPIDASRAASIYERSAGNPFLVEEIVAAGSHADAGGPSMPGLEALVRRRIATLPRAARDVLAALAIVDGPAPPTLVTGVAGTSRRATALGLDALVQSGLVILDDDRARLRHPVFGEVVRADLGTIDRAGLHRNAATALADAGGDPAEIAGHWWHSGDDAAAWTWALAAAEDAERRLAFGAARLQLERALRRWPPGVPGRAAAGLRAARAAWIGGDPVAALEQARTAVDSESGELDVAGRLDATLAIGAYAWDAGRRHVAIVAFERAASLLDAGSTPAHRARALWGLGRARIGQGTLDEPGARAGLDEARALAAAAADTARSAGATDEEAESLLLLGMVEAFAGTTEGVESVARGVALARSAGAPPTTGHGFQFLVDLLALAGRRGDALATATEGIEACERLGLGRTHAADLRGRSALLSLDAGDVDAAEAVLLLAEPRAFVELARARLAIRRGAWAGAEAALEAAAGAGAIGGPGALGGWLELTRVELAARRGDPAAPGLAAAVPMQRGVWGRDVAAWQATWGARLGVLEPPASAMLDAVRHHPDAVLAAAMAAELVARGIGADAGAAASPAGWAAAATAWDRAGRPDDAAHARLELARSSILAGDRAGARTTLDAVIDAGTRLGSPPLVVRALDVARRAGMAAPARRRVRPDPSAPTARELEVLLVLAEGLTNAQLAERLFLSPKTVGIHVSRLLQKLDAHTRGEAVAVARRRGLVP